MAELLLSWVVIALQLAVIVFAWSVFLVPAGLPVIGPLQASGIVLMVYAASIDWTVVFGKPIDQGKDVASYVARAVVLCFLLAVVAAVEFVLL